VQFVIVLGLSLCALGLFENFLHQRNLRRIPIRILVNGTRGKSSVTRLIAGALRQAGYRTIAKTTGSEASIILDDGSETPVSRPFGPRITEQKALARLAVRRSAQALVVECMAVRAESQMVMQRQLVRSTIGVITNVRVDHIEEIGRDLDETAAALSQAIPRDGTLVTTDPRFTALARRVVLADPSRIPDEVLSRFPYPAFAENVALALHVADELGIDGETALEGMVGARPDIGVLRVLEVEFPAFRAFVANGFAANDVVSTKMVWARLSGLVPAGLPLVLLYNNRADREYRIPEFARMAKDMPDLRMVAAVGDHPKKVARMFSGCAPETIGFDPGTTAEQLLASIGARIGAAFLLFGVGNIQGMGKSLMGYCIERGRPRGGAGEEQCFRNR